MSRTSLGFMRLGIGGCFRSLISVFTFIGFREGFAWIEHFPILLAGEVADQSAHHRAGGLIAVGQFDKCTAKDHLAAGIAFPL